MTEALKIASCLARAACEGAQLGAQFSTPMCPEA